MNRITEHNYEAYYLDYMEGNLCAEDVAALLVFLEQHPEFKQDVDSYDEVVLVPSATEFSNKSFLKKIPNSDHLMIGAIENCNTQKENEELERLISESATLKSNFELYKKTLLKKSQVVFVKKEQLKKKESVLVYLYPLSAAAAILVLFFLVYRGSETTSPMTEDAVIGYFQLQNSDNSTIDSLQKQENVEKDNLVIESNPANKKKVPLITSPKRINTLDKDIINPNYVPTYHQPDVVIDVNKDSNDLHQKNKDIAKDTVKVSSLSIGENELVTTSVVKKDPLTLKQVINNKIRKNILKEEDPSFDNITGTEMMSTITTGIAAKTEKEATFAQEVDKNKEVTQFTLGKFEFYRSKSK